MKLDYQEFGLVMLIVMFVILMSFAIVILSEPSESDECDCIRGPSEAYDWDANRCGF